MPAHRVLVQRQMLLQIFIVSLSVFFIALIVAVVLSSRTLPSRAAIPTSLWIATGMLAITSWQISRSLAAVRCEQQRSFRQALQLAVGFGAGFLGVQLYGLLQLLKLHGLPEQQSRTWILLFLLVGLHFVHVLVGWLLLVRVWRQAAGNRFDHEYHLSVVLLASYWRFLDLVWIAILMVTWYLLR